MIQWRQFKRWGVTVLLMGIQNVFMSLGVSFPPCPFLAVFLYILIPDPTVSLHDHTNSSSGTMRFLTYSYATKTIL